eukprot:1159432-Pelagomonas_calceolata.AAC.4
MDYSALLITRRLFWLYSAQRNIRLLVWHANAPRQTFVTALLLTLQCTVHCGLLDAAEDTNPDAFWFWELREPKKALMPQQQQQQQPSGAGTQQGALL